MLTHRTPTICLTMVLRDDAEVVEATLASVIDHVHCWVAVDVGSRDATPEIVTAHFDAHDVPGRLVHRPHHDAASDRSEVLALARPWADYCWMVDPGHVLEGDLDLRRLTADAYALRHRGSADSWRTQIFRSDGDWRFEGTLHERPVRADRHPVVERLEGDHCIVAAPAARRSRRMSTYPTEVPQLEAIAAEVPSDALAVFCLAQSLFLDGRHPEARDAFARRLALAAGDGAAGGEGEREETFWAMLQEARCREWCDEPWGEVVAAYLSCWQARPTRAEPLADLARICRLDEDFELGALFAERGCAIPLPVGEQLHVETDVYRWRLRDTAAICAFSTGHPDRCRELCQDLLDGGDLPDDERSRVRRNRDLAARRLAPPGPATCAATSPAGEAARRELLDERRDEIDRVVAASLRGARQVSLVNFPNHANPGDVAIWLGARDCLGRLGVEVAYCSSWSSYSTSALERAHPDGPVLLGGGGNLGDVYMNQQSTRELVLRDLPHRPVVQLPQSLFFDRPEHGEAFAGLCRAHGDVTLLLREHDSVGRAAELGLPVVECPDLAHALGPLGRPRPAATDVVVLARHDGERRGHDWSRATSRLADVEVVDWLTPAVHEPPIPAEVRRTMAENARLHAELARHTTAGAPWAPLAATFDPLARYWLGRGLDCLARGRVVITDRLHGHLLCLLLGIPHVALDSATGKVHAVAETSARRWPGVVLASTAEEAVDAAERLLATGREVDTCGS